MAARPLVSVPDSLVYSASGAQKAAMAWHVALVEGVAVLDHGLPQGGGAIGRRGGIRGGVRGGCGRRRLAADEADDQPGRGQDAQRDGGSLHCTFLPDVHDRNPRPPEMP